MLKEFKEFALRGNVVDMAVGIIIGAAFGAITKSLVTDVIMPPIGVLIGGVDFTDLFITLSEGEYATLAEAQEAGAATLNVGIFINAVINFFIVAVALFLLIRAINSMKRKQEATPPSEPTTKNCPHCLSAVPLMATRCAYCTSALDAP